MTPILSWHLYIFWFSHGIVSLTLQRYGILKLNEMKLHLFITPLINPYSQRLFSPNSHNFKKMDNSRLAFHNGAQYDPHVLSSTQLPFNVSSQDRVAKICKSPPNSPILEMKAKTVRRKPSDYPRRPLSAYNLFFQSERQNLITIRDQEATPFTPKKGIGGFANLARAIATKWKLLGEDERSPFEDEARLCRIRYMAEVKIWKSKQTVNRKANVQHQPDDVSSFHKKMNYFPPSPQLPSSVIPSSSVTPERLQVLNKSSQTTRMLLKQMFAMGHFNESSRALCPPQEPRSSMSHPMTSETNPSPTTFSEETFDECFYQASRHVVTPPLDRPVISFEHAFSSSCWDELVEHFGRCVDDDSNSIMPEPIGDDDLENFFERIDQFWSQSCIESMLHELTQTKLKISFWNCSSKSSINLKGIAN